MDAQIAEVVKMLLTLDTAVLVVIVPLSFIASELALKGLEKLDLWMSRKAREKF